MPAQTTVPGGVQRFASELVPALCARGAEVQQYRLHPAPGRSRSLAAVAGWRAISRDHRRLRFDALLTTFHWPPRLNSLRTFGVLHDLRSCPPSLFAPARVLRAGTTATWTATFVPSTQVGDSVRAILGSRRTVVIGEGLDHLDRYHLAPPPERSGILVIAGRAPHKRGRLGLDAAIAASERLRCSITVVGAPGGDIPPTASVLEDPDDATLAKAYQSALVAVVASSYEGFGLAAGEALRAGTPVVYAADGTLADLVGRGGLPAQPTVTALAHAVEQAASRADELGRAARDAAAPHTWEATAARVLETIEAEVLRTQPTVSATGKRRPPTTRLPG